MFSSKQQDSLLHAKWLLVSCIFFPKHRALQDVVDFTKAVFKTCLEEKESNKRVLDMNQC